MSFSIQTGDQESGLYSDKGQKKRAQKFFPQRNITPSW